MDDQDWVTGDMLFTAEPGQVYRFDGTQTVTIPLSTVAPGWNDSTCDEEHWEDSRHRVRLIENLDTDHLENIVRKFAREGIAGTCLNQGWKAPYIIEELDRRRGDE